MKEPAVTTLTVIHQGAIGDFILALSIVQAVATKVRAARVVAIASAPSAGLAAGRSVINRRVTPDDVALHSLFSDEPILNPRLQECLSGSDFILSFLGSQDGPVHRRLCAAVKTQVVSIDPRPSQDTLTRRRHITSQWQEALAPEGIELAEIGPPVIRMDSHVHSPGDGLSSVMIHPGSGGRGKCWPAKRFIELANRLEGCRIAWMLGPAETESPERPSKLIHRRCETRGETLLVEEDLAKAAGHVAAADLYVGNDAGMTHLAAAVGVATVAIFGPTDPAVWRPLGGHVSIVGPRRPGSPIDQVATDDVENAVHSRLAGLV
jgi:heptosyltransferase III